MAGRNSFRTTMIVGGALAALLLVGGPASAAHAVAFTWTDQFGTVAFDSGQAVATDAAGNVYVAGYTAGALGGPSAGSDDAFVRKYSPVGVLDWTRQFGTSAGDRAFGVSVDGSGNVYVTGWTLGVLGASSAGGQDAFVRKYDSAGAHIWTDQYGTAGTDSATAVSADASGNAYLSGTTSGALEGTNAGGDDAYVRKYNSVGAHQWTDQFGTSGTDRGTGVANDPTGQAYVVGSTSGTLEGIAAGGAFDAFAARYTAFGAVMWIDQYGTSGDDQALAVVSGPSGNAWTAGSTTGTLEGSPFGGTDAYVREYHPTNVVLWTDQFGTSGTDVATAVAADASYGNTYVAGRTDGLLGAVSAGSIDAFVRSYNPLTINSWTEQFGSSGIDDALGVATDASGDVYAAGSSSGAIFEPSAGGTDAWVAGLGASPSPLCTVTGTAGDDNLVGTLGADVICALGGNDKVSALSGADVIYGGPGDDQIFGGGAGDLVYGEGGSDELLGQDGGDYLDGGADDDRLWGGDAGDEIHGGQGNDAANARTGNDALYGEEGADQLQGGGGNDLFSGGSDDDLLMGQPGDDRFDGADGNDAIQAGDGNDWFESGSGADQVVTALGFDVGQTREGDDLVIETDGGVDVRGGSGNDTLIGGDGSDALRAGPGNDQVYGNGDSDHIHGDAGNDVIDAGSGDDKPTVACPACGVWGDQHDTVTGHLAGTDYLPTDGNDSILGGDGDDAVYGGGGNDELFGAHGADYIEDAEGDNVVQTGVDADVVLMGWYTSVSGFGSPVPATKAGMGFGNNDVQTGEANDFIETASGNDDIMGGIDDDTIKAGDGDNVINGMAGDDDIETGSGNDDINADSGEDTVHSGAGNDEISAGADDDIVVAGAGVDIVNGEGGIDEIWLGGDNDTAFGDFGDDKIYGGLGDDQMQGGDGNDLLIGEGGVDTANGSLGIDACDAETELECENDPPLLFVVPPEPA